MELTQYQLDILNAKICPYCKSETRVTTETEIYGKEYKGRKVICCVNFPKCDSYVGTHDDETPLGKLADKELRKWKRKAHENFDKLWQDNLMTRSEAYKEMSKAMEIPQEYTHIGMFSVSTCKKVFAWSILTYNKLL